MIRTLTLSDGTKIDTTMCSVSGDQLVIRLSETMTMEQAAKIFEVAEALEEMTLCYSEGAEMHYQGYSKLAMVSRDLQTDQVTVSLRRG